MWEVVGRGHPRDSDVFQKGQILLRPGLTLVVRNDMIAILAAKFLAVNSAVL